MNFANSKLLAKEDFLEQKKLKCYIFFKQISLKYNGITKKSNVTKPLCINLLKRTETRAFTLSGTLKRFLRHHYL